MKIKFLAAHVEDCYAIKNFRDKSWSTPWTFCRPESKFGSKVTPLRQGSRIWIIGCCNCTYCPAKIAVLEESLGQMPPGYISKHAKRLKRPSS